MRRQRQLILVCEGADIVGKTNIGLALSNKLRIPYFKNRLETPSLYDKHYFFNTLKYAQPIVLQLLEQTRQSIIFDRSYPSEFVYSQVYNRGTDFDLLASIDKRYSKLDTRIFIFERENYSGLKDDIIESDKILAVREKYHEFAKFTKCKINFVNVDDENLDREVDEVISTIT